MHGKRGKGRMDKLSRAERIFRILLMVLYLGVDIIVLYLIFSQVKYPAIVQKSDWKILAILIFFMLVVPIVVILPLFVRKEGRAWRNFKIVDGIVGVILLPTCLLAALYGSMGIASHTTNPDCYGIYDAYVETSLQDSVIDILPESVPEESKDIAYLYDYRAAFDDSYLKLELSWQYEDEAEYIAFVSEMQQKGKESAPRQNGYNMINLNGGTDEKKKILFGYDDAQRRVGYWIDYCW